MQYNNSAALTFIEIYLNLFGCVYKTHKKHLKKESIEPIGFFQRFHFECGSVVAVWRSSPVAESATSSESNTHTHSQEAVGLCLQGNAPTAYTHQVFCCCSLQH